MDLKFSRHPVSHLFTCFNKIDPEMQVKLEQGLQLLKIFKEHSSKTFILDDFAFYEARQKTIQEKKAKQQQFQKQVSSSSSCVHD